MERVDIWQIRNVRFDLVPSCIMTGKYSAIDKSEEHMGLRDIWKDPKLSCDRKGTNERF